MAEALKETYESLPESEKRKFIEEVLKKSSRDVSNSCLENSLLGSPGKSSCGNGSKRAYEETSPENNSSDSKKKQRTLDSWLIKRGSSSKDKQHEPSCQTKTQDNINSSNITNNSENSLKEKVPANNIENVNCTSTFHSITNGNGFSNDMNHTNDKSENNNNIVKNLLFDSCGVEKSDSVTEKYNLRSKRKFSKLSPIKECNDGAVKCPKKGNVLCDNNNDLNCHKRTSKKENEKLKSSIELAKSQTAETSVIQQSSLSNNTQLLLNDNAPSDIQHQEDECLDIDVSTNSKSSHKNRSRKKKIHAKCSNGVVVYEDLNNQSNVVASENNEQTSATTVSQQSNYEAFYKLNTEFSRIGLNIFDILGDEKIQNLLSDHKKLNNEAVIFLGSFNSNTGKILPVVHLLESKKKLLENICLLQKTQKHDNSNC